MERLLTLAYSPCPNDTFMFSALASGRVSSQNFSFDIRLHDVQTLNERVLNDEFDVSKVSIHAYLKARDRYELLNAGAAVGFGCGPIVVARSADALADPASARVAIPGALTTANLLLHLWNPEIEPGLCVSYDKVMDEVLSGRADAGVIIHESRFVYKELGLEAVVDLGEWWEKETGLPIPLGGIVGRRSLGNESLRELEALIRESIRDASRHPEETTTYVRAHAQELSGEVLDRHVAMFVNDFSLHLGEPGRAAIEKMSAMLEGKPV